MQTIGVVLAGGRSSRMGRDKAALLRDDGRTWLNFSMDVLREASCEQVFVSGRSGEHGIIDRQVHAGPAAALIDAYLHIVSEFPASGRLVFIPVDLPNLTAETIAYLSQSAASAVHFKHHPLPLVLNNSPIIQAYIQSISNAQNMSVHRLVAGLDHEQLTCPPQLEASLTNVNTLAEYTHHEN